MPNRLSASQPKPNRTGPARRRQHVRMAAVSAIVAFGLIRYSAGVGASERSQLVAAASPISTTATTDTATTTTDTTTTTATSDTTASIPTPAALEPGDRGPAVEKLQRELATLGFRSGDSIDGNYGPGTVSAVMAFQKYEGLDRDGVAGTTTLTQLDHPSDAPPRWAGTGPHIDIDLSRQLLFVWTDSGGPTILNTSTGSGATFVAPNGNKEVASTPTGDFTIERRIDGVRDGPLGRMYRPMYFFRGWAIHGSPNIPSTPLSHGCARVRNNDQDWLVDHIATGTSVSVY